MEILLSIIALAAIIGATLFYQRREIAKANQTYLKSKHTQVDTETLSSVFAGLALTRTQSLCKRFSETDLRWVDIARVQMRRAFELLADMAAADPRFPGVYPLLGSQSARLGAAQAQDLQAAATPCPGGHELLVTQGA